MLHLSWHEIIGAHLTSRIKQAWASAEKPGKVLDGVTALRGDDVVKTLKSLDHNVFDDASIAAYSHDDRLDMIRWLKRIADRLQRIDGLQKHMPGACHSG